MDKLRFVIARAREPGSWRAISLALGFAGLNVPDPTMQAIAGAGMALAALAAVLLPETPAAVGAAPAGLAGMVTPKLYQ